MMGDLDGWGRDLPDEERAASAAVRIFAIRSGREIDNGEQLRELARGRWRGGKKRALTWSELRERWGSGTTPVARLARAWHEAFAQSDGLRVPLPSIATKMASEDAAFADEMFLLLGRLPAEGVVAVSLVATAQQWRRFRWPLRVGLGPGTIASAGLGNVTGRYHDFFRVGELSEAQPDWDIIVLDSSVEDAAERTTGAVRPTARFVVVTRGSDAISFANTAAATNALRRQMRALGLAIVRFGAADLDAFLWGLADEIGHDRPIDSAVAMAARSVQGDVRLMVGDERFLTTTSVSHAARELGKKMASVASLVTRSRLPPIGALPGWDHIDAGVAKPSSVFADVNALARTFSTRSSEADWTREGRAATGTTILAEAVRDALEDAAHTATPRYLQCQVRNVDRSEEPLVRKLVSGRNHALLAWVGPRDWNALGLRDAFPEPSPEPAEHELTVVVHDAALLGEPMRGTILLPPIGAAQPVRFHLRLKPEVSRIEARVVVLHRGRVLQTGVLRGGIATNEDDDVEPLTFRADAMPRRRLQKLGSRSAFGAAIVANHDQVGVATKLAIVGNKVASIRLNEMSLKNLVDRFNAALSDVASGGDYQTLTSPGNVELLRDLAQHGSVLHKAILNHARVGPDLVMKTRLQIVAARPDSFLPLELAYAYEAPDDDATLCDGADAALAVGSCPGTCATAEIPPGGTDKRICPLGFWCMTKVIERFEHVPEHTEVVDDYELRAEAIGDRPTLSVPQHGLIAASAKATSVNPNAVSDVVAAAPSVAFDRAADWNEWVQKLSGSNASLLVLLPHHVDRAGATMLELGSGSQLKSTNVKPKHTLGDPIRRPPRNPMVFLLGCETTQSLIALESFPAAFLEQGAAIVLGTIATVLGRDASAAAVRLVQSMATPSGERTFGDILLAARRQLVRDGRVMALALAGFGDADWRIG